MLDKRFILSFILKPDVDNESISEHCYNSYEEVDDGNDGDEVGGGGLELGPVAGDHLGKLQF